MYGECLFGLCGFVCKHDNITTVKVIEKHINYELIKNKVTSISVHFIITLCPAFPYTKSITQPATSVCLHRHFFYGGIIASLEFIKKKAERIIQQWFLTMTKTLVFLLYLY